MSPLVYRICALLCQVLQSVPVGTNLGLFHLLWALLSGRFLLSRGAVFPALDALGLPPDTVRRAAAALTYGRFDPARLLRDWQRLVRAEGVFVAHSHDGVRPVPVDLVGFFRPRLRDCPTKHYTSQAGKALPAQVFGMVGATGSVGKSRLCLPRLLEPMPADLLSEAAFARSLVRQASASLADAEALILDAGFALADLLSVENARFVMRGPKNFTARRNFLAPYAGVGRHAEYGEYVRPLARTYRSKRIDATPPDGEAHWRDGRYRVRALLFEDLVLSESLPGSPSFRCVVVFHARYPEPLVLVTNLPGSVSAQALWRLYRDRWPIEQMPLAAKQMLGAGRAFVFTEPSRERLPPLALLAGNILSYVAATSAPVATGFWDRACRRTCGRLRRALARVDFSELSFARGRLREKASVTAHLPKGVQGHRRHKALPKPFIERLAA